MDERKINLLLCVKLYFGKRFENTSQNHTMKKVILFATVSFFTVFATQAQTTNFEWQNLIKNVKATVKVLNDGELYTLVPDSNANMRYISQQLPEEYKKDGLKVTFTGWEGKIPPNFRMMGKPLKLKSICVTKSEQKKFKLKKARYSFK
jgi:hypothetical protein